MIDCPELNSRLEWILGAGYFYTGSYAMVSPYGAAGQRIHSGPFYSHSQGYVFRQGNEPRQNGVNIGWALQVNPLYVCITALRGVNALCMYYGLFPYNR
eukprot:COSAG05_NODE_1574_length_4515_cov_2.683877_4_plen_99_part_00